MAVAANAQQQRYGIQDRHNLSLPTNPTVNDVERFTRGVTVQRVATLLTGHGTELLPEGVPGHLQQIQGCINHACKAIEGADPDVQKALIEGVTRIMDSIEKVQKEAKKLQYTPQNPLFVKGLGGRTIAFKK